MAETRTREQIITSLAHGLHIADETCGRQWFQLSNDEIRHYVNTATRAAEYAGFIARRSPSEDAERFRKKRERLQELIRFIVREEFRRAGGMSEPITSKGLVNQ